MVNKDGNDTAYVYIFGAGRIAKLLLKKCMNYRIDVKAFLVSDTDCNVAEIDGIPVVDYRSVVNKNTEVMIGVLERGEKQIEETLRTLGYTNIKPLEMSILEKDEVAEHRKKSPIMEITPKIGCTVNCNLCPQNLLLNRYFRNDKKRQAMMSFDEYREYLSKLPMDCIIDFSGYVEPFLNPFSIEMMEYTFSEGREMTLFTTLQGINDEIMERLLRIHFSWVVLHVADSEGYANIPITDEYLERLDRLIRAKKEDGSPFINEANCQNTPHASVLEITKGKIKIYCELQDRAGSIQEKKLSLSRGNMTPPMCCSRAHNVNHFVLLPDGTVTLCCNDYGLHHILGNMKTQSYDEIINGKEMKRIKESMTRDNGYPIICRKCMFAIPSSISKN